MSTSGYAAPEYGVETYGSGGLYFGPRMPRVSAWVSFTTDPGDEPVWEDVSLYLRSFTIKRGRQYELDQFAAGTATITLNNQDRRFDPTYVDSPYYPNVLPMKRIKLTATWGSEYTLFDGYVDGWPQSYNQPHEARVDVQATDAFKVLALAKMASSVYEYEVRQDAPVHWWRMGEKQGTDVLDSGSDPVTGVYNGLLNYGGTGISPYDSDTSIEFVDPNANGGGYFNADTDVTGTGDFSIEFWLNNLLPLATPLGQGAPGFSNKKVDESFVQRPMAWDFITNSLSIIDGDGNWLSQGARIIFNAYNADADFVGDVNTGFIDQLAESGWHHIVVTRSGNTFKIYADGVLRNTDTINVSLVGGQIIGPMDDYAAGDTVGMDEVAIYDSALSAARVQAHYDAAISSWAGDASEDRVTRALDVARFSSTSRSLETGIATLGSAVLNNQTVMAHIQDVELAESGEFFIAADGTATFYNRHHLSTPPGATPRATFGDGAGENKYADIVVNYDDTHIINEARITRAGGTTQVHEDATSQGKYLTRTFERSDVHTETDTDSFYGAQALVTRFKNPSVRIDSITIKCQRDADNLFPIVLDLDLLDAITVKRRPQGIGDPISEDVAIEGITHDVNPETWVTTFQLGQLPPSMWVLEDPDYGVLDETTRAAW